MSSSVEGSLDSLSKEILQLDTSIRFAGIANNLGSLVATAYRSGLTPLMNKLNSLVVIYFFFLLMPYNFRLSDFCKYVVIYVTPPDKTPMLSRPANA